MTLERSDAFAAQHVPNLNVVLANLKYYSRRNVGHYLALEVVVSGEK